MHFSEQPGSPVDASVRPLPPRAKTAASDKSDPDAFKVFPDYSKHNAGMHNRTRSDTFQTPRSANRKGAGNMKMASEDSNAVSSAYLISGIRNDVRDIGKEINRGIQEEAQHTLTLMHGEVKALQAEVQGVLTVLGDLRESTIGVVMERLKTDIHGILSAAGWPLKVDWTPIQDDYKEGEKNRLESYQRSHEHLESRMGLLVDPLVNEIPLIKGIVGQLSAELKESQDAMRTEMQNLREALVSDLSARLMEVQNTQQEELSKIGTLEKSMETQLVAHVQKKPVKVNFEPVVSSMEGKFSTLASDINAVQSDLKLIRDSIAQVQTEVHSIEEIDAEKQKLQDSRVVDVDSNWTQTDVIETATGFAQTDDKFWKAKAAKGRKSTEAAAVPNPGELKRAATKTMKEKSKGGVIPDAEAMKRKARMALIKHQYNVFDLYHETGFCQKVAKSSLFENVTFAVVALNALWISVDADHNDADLLLDAHPVFQVAENIFCTYFTWELSTRFLAFKRKINCLKDAWFVFDLFLVTLMVIETWVMTIIFIGLGGGSSMDINASMLRLIRIVKIARLSRLARLMRAVPEIIIFIKGIGAAARSVCSLFALWMIIIYIFAVFFVQTLHPDTKQEYFSSVPEGMNTLLLEGIFPDNSGLVNLITAEDMPMWPLIVGFVLLASITLSYMLIGVLVQIVNVIGSTEKEKSLVTMVISTLKAHWAEKGFDTEVPLNKDDFQAVLVDASIAQFLQGLGVDVVVIVEMSDMIFDDCIKESKDSGGVTFENFIDIILNMRGQNPVTVRDIKSSQRAVKQIIKDAVLDSEKRQNDKLAKCLKAIHRVRKTVLGDDDGESDPEEPADPVGGDPDNEDVDGKHHDDDDVVIAALPAPDE